MTDDIERLVSDYYAWMRDRTVLRRIEGWTEITTPYLDRHNDYIQIFARKENGGFVITDDGRTIGDLQMGGCSLGGPKRQALLRTTLSGFGVGIEGDALQVHASASDFPLRKHSLVQAILAVDDMFCLAAPTVASIFHEEVVSWLDSHDVRYTANIKFCGKTGFDQSFDFIIPKSKKQPERIVQPINRPNRDSAQRVLLAWSDTRSARPQDSRAYALLNDSDYEVPSTVVDALRNYEIRPVMWSRRMKVIEELAA